MAKKPVLPYVTYFHGNDYLGTALLVEGFLIRPLAKSGRVRFIQDSEILEFVRDPFGVHGLYACVARVDQNGKIGPESCYFSHGPKFAERTKEIWSHAIRTGLDIFPVAEPNKNQARYIDLKLFPSPAQAAPFMGLLETYLKANPDPSPRLATVNSSELERDHTLKTFLSMAGEFFEPVEIQPKKISGILVREGQNPKDGKPILEF